MSAALQRGQRGWRGQVVAPHAPQRLPINRGFSAGQVETSGASAFGIGRASSLSFRGQPRVRSKACGMPESWLPLRRMKVMRRVRIRQPASVRA